MTLETVKDGDPLAPIRCVGCGAVNSAWTRLGTGAIFASSIAVAAWAFSLWATIGTALWWPPWIGAVGLMVAFDRFGTRFGVRECRFCGSTRIEPGEWLCEAHGPVQRVPMIPWTVIPLSLVPAAMLVFALSRIGSHPGSFVRPELALSGIAVLLAGTIILESRRRSYRSVADGQPCTCRTVVPSWSEAGRSIVAHRAARAVTSGTREHGSPAERPEA